MPNANLYLPVMMIAEKAADLILGNCPVASDHVKFCRHERTGEPSPAVRLAS